MITSAPLAAEARALAADLRRGITRAPEEIADLVEALSYVAEWHENVIRDQPVFIAKEAGPEVFYLGVDGTLYQLGDPGMPEMPARDAVIMRALLEHALLTTGGQQ